MVKFKFPGKPSKIVQRSLVSAYSVVVPSCDTSSVSEDVCFGLSLFQSTFGNDDDVSKHIFIACVLKSVKTLHLRFTCRAMISLVLPTKTSTKQGLRKEPKRIVFVRK